MDQIIYKLALVLHVAGITIMAGTTFIDFITFRQFLRVFPTDRAKGLLLEENLYKLQRFLGIGMLVILLSGVGMMAYLHQVWGQQIWFRVKMGVLILIIINGLAIRRRLGNQLKKLLTENAEANFDAGLPGFRSRMALVQSLQLLFFVVMFVLSVFKFN